MAKTKAQYEAEKKAKKEAKDLAARENAAKELKDKTRKPEEVQKSYDSAIIQIGDREFRRELLAAELVTLRQRAYDLSKEYATACAVHGKPVPAANQETPQPQAEAKT